MRCVGLAHAPQPSPGRGPGRAVTGHSCLKGDTGLGRRPFAQWLAHLGASPFQRRAPGSLPGGDGLGQPALRLLQAPLAGCGCAACPLQLLVNLAHPPLGAETCGAFPLELLALGAIARADGRHNDALFGQLLLGVLQGPISDEMGVALKRQLFLYRAQGLLSGLLGGAQGRKRLAHLLVAFRRCRLPWLGPGKAGVVPFGEHLLGIAKQQPEAPRGSAAAGC